MRAVFLFWILCAAPALAAPSESPPSNFSGAQYIDSAGCVFARDGDRWVARIERDGNVVCGYPPTLTNHAPTEAQDHSTTSPASTEAALAATLAEGLQDGDLSSQTASQMERSPARAVKSPESGPLADLDLMIQATPVVQQAMGAGLHPNGRLCDLLGYKSSVGSLPSFGSDATQGFCANDGVGGGLTDEMIVTQGAAATTPAVAVETGFAVSTAQDAESRSSSNTRRPVPLSPGQSPTLKLSKPTKPARPNSPRAPRMVREEMIPAGARFVFIGIFSTEVAKQTVSRNLLSLGYPIAHGRSQTAKGAAGALYAGPFDDRRALVAALNDLRARGIGKPAAR